MMYFTIELWKFNFKTRHPERGQNPMVVPVAGQNQKEAFDNANSKTFGTIYWPQKHTLIEITEMEFNTRIKAIEKEKVKK